MGDPEDHDYVRISDPVAAYAFYTHSSGVSLLNLRWLSEVVQQYEASARRLADIPTEQGRIEHMRAIVEQVDDDRLAWFIRQQAESSVVSHSS